MGKYAIFIVSALIFSMLTYSSALRNALFQSHFRNIESFSQLQASNIANSAALVVINDIRNDSDSDFAPEEGETYSYPSSTGFADWEDLEGSYNVQVTNNADTLTIQSSGRFEETNYRVTIAMTKGGTSEWLGASVDKAIHSDSEMDLGNGSIDGDLSLNESYNEFTGGPQADVKGSLYFYDEGPVFDDEMEEYEDMFTQPDNASDDYNHMYKLDEKIVHQNPIFPNFTVTGSGDYSSRNGYESWTNGASFNSFNANGTTIDTGNKEGITKITVNDLDLSKDLNITGNGSVHFYVSEDLNLGNGNINNYGDTPSSKNLTIFYRGIDDISFNGNGTFRGTLFAGSNDVSVSIGGNPIFDGNLITFGNEVTLNGAPVNSALVFAPNAHVTLKGTAGSFRGAIVSDSYSASGQPSVIYDAEFASTLPQLEQEDNKEFVLLYWN